MKERPKEYQNKDKQKPRTLGPVPYLEEHVNPDWWKKIFNSLYLKTDADIVEDATITRQEIDTFSSILKLTPESHVLDLCCGQGRHTLELARRGLKNLDGLDRSHYLIQRAKTTAKKESLGAKFKEGDARKTPYATDTFDVVMLLGNSFGYFETSDEDLRVLKEVKRILKPWGKVLLDVADGSYLKEKYQPRSWEWIDKHNFVCRERSISTDGQKLISREVIVNDTSGVIADQFYAERLYTTDALKELLKKAEFTDIEIVDSINSQTLRNQDLGMMERRIIVTATVRKEWTPKKKKAKEAKKNVVVVFGDPRKNDSLKPCGVFDDDDMYTIDQLKGGLYELENYSFKYLDNHDTLVTDLAKIRSKTDFVFNLCDEGYDNDPKKELHVPAILEMFNIPYTGSGPQCLAFCYDKALVRGIAKDLAVPVPEGIVVKGEDTLFELPMDFPVIVKPNFGDSSFGLNQHSVCNSRDEVVRAIYDIREGLGYDKPILVEEFLTGKDLSIGIIGNPPENYTVLPLTQEDYSDLPEDLPKLCGYEAKWIPDSPYWKIKSSPADLPKETEELIVECSLKLINRLECRDYTRLDWRLDAKGNPKLLEVNPNPGWCWDGHLAKMAKIADISYSDMIAMILKSADDRISGQKQG
ncbi:D-alanine-D-alanine ligase [Methanolobus vulcani]|jgi:D-alanine-D-alanine ligase|uniref:D-alanine-D-alanine ligase n=1 Tax=Methanolobus vulcani TaxID=38026 RepID=A0A7Z7FCK4_9EURY|nr:methyltransferase domain-containing protein [Methanolobus vulcani]MDK2826462.1 D-alanine-D-alanine ligase [Methanolobus sp.]MDK2948574.1 D-alanine-D-alanine ligase [Methanolobus sp.]SDF73270.1 D-alanine-D-alanine ligase [Methanolobus vulcani]